MHAQLNFATLLTSYSDPAALAQRRDWVLLDASTICQHWIQRLEAVPRPRFCPAAGKAAVAVTGYVTLEARACQSLVITHATLGDAAHDPIVKWHPFWLGR